MDLNGRRSETARDEGADRSDYRASSRPRRSSARIMTSTGYCMLPGSREYHR